MGWLDPNGATREGHLLGGKVVSAGGEDTGVEVHHVKGSGLLSDLNEGRGDNRFGLVGRRGQGCL